MICYHIDFRMQGIISSLFACPSVTIFTPPTGWMQLDGNVAVVHVQLFKERLKTAAINYSKMYNQSPSLSGFVQPSYNNTC